MKCRVIDAGMEGHLQISVIGGACQAVLSLLCSYERKLRRIANGITALLVVCSLLRKQYVSRQHGMRNGAGCQHDKPS